MNYYKGNFNQDREVSIKEGRKEWLIGQFMNEKTNDIRGTDKFAVKFWKFKKGQETNHPPKYQRFATESTFILKGKLKARIENDEFLFVEGDYVVIPPNTVSNLAIEVLEDAEGITIKAPSCIPDDTVKLSKAN